MEHAAWGVDFPAAQVDGHLIPGLDGVHRVGRDDDGQRVVERVAVIDARAGFDDQRGHARGFERGYRLLPTGAVPPIPAADHNVTRLHARRELRVQILQRVLGHLLWIVHGVRVPAGEDDVGVHVIAVLPRAPAQGRQVTGGGLQVGSCRLQVNSWIQVYPLIQNVNDVRTARFHL